MKTKRVDKSVNKLAAIDYQTPERKILVAKFKLKNRCTAKATFPAILAIPLRGKKQTSKVSAKLRLTIKLLSAIKRASLKSETRRLLSYYYYSKLFQRLERCNYIGFCLARNVHLRSAASRSFERYERIYTFSHNHSI